MVKIMKHIRRGVSLGSINIPYSFGEIEQTHTQKDRRLLPFSGMEIIG